MSTTITITFDVNDLRDQLKNYDKWYRNRIDVIHRSAEGEKLKRGEDTRSAKDFGDASKSLGWFFEHYLRTNGIYDRDNGGILSPLLLQNDTKDTTP